MVALLATPGDKDLGNARHCFVWEGPARRTAMEREKKPRSSYNPHPIGFRMPLHGLRSKKMTIILDILPKGNLGIGFGMLAEWTCNAA